MSDGLPASILRRMIAPKPAGPEEVPITSSRAVRMATRRAADKAHGLIVSVLGMQEETVSVDGLSEAIDDTHLLVGLAKQGSLTGLAAIDVQLRAAIIEIQTMGALQTATAEPRAATATDAVMMTEFLAMLLKMLGETTARTDLEGWTKGTQVGQRVTSVRAAGLVLSDVDYRLIRLTLDLGAGERQGELAVLLPAGNAVPSEVVVQDQQPDWQLAFKQSVSDSAATLTAQLHRFSMSLQTAENLTEGQVIPLSGCTVDTVQLLDPNGKFVSGARLGQFAGKRAVRIETGQVLQMAETPTLPKATSPAQIVDGVAT